MQFAEQIKYYLNFAENLKDLQNIINDCIVSCDDIVLSRKNIKNIIQENEIINDEKELVLLTEAMLVIFFWKNQNKSFYNIILDGIIESDFFREASIYYIQENKIDSTEFCSFIIEKYNQNPKRFLMIKSDYDFDWINNNNPQTPLTALYDVSISYSEIDILPLRLIITLIPNKINNIVKILMDVHSPLIQYNTCFDIISELYENYSSQTKQLFSAIINNFVDLNYNSCSIAQRAFIEMLRAIYQYANYFEEKTGNNGNNKTILNDFSIVLKNRQDKDIIVLVLGCFLINNLDGDYETNYDNDCNIWKKTTKDLLDMLKDIPIKNPDIEKMWIISRESSDLTIENVHNCFKNEGLVLNTKTSCMAAFLLCSYLNWRDIKLQKELLLLALESNDRLLWTCTLNLDLNHPIWNKIGDFVCQSDMLIDFWFELRTSEFNQIYYRYRFQRLRSNGHNISQTTKYYPIISIIIIDKLIENMKIQKAEKLWDIIWYDFINQIYLSFGIDDNFDTKLLFYMIYLKLELIKVGLCDDMKVRLNEIPQLMSFPQKAKEFINDYKTKSY